MSMRVGVKSHQSRRLGRRLVRGDHLEAFDDPLHNNASIRERITETSEVGGDAEARAVDAIRNP